MNCEIEGHVRGQHAAVRVAVPEIVVEDEHTAEDLGLAPGHQYLGAVGAVQAKGGSQKSPTSCRVPLMTAGQRPGREKTYRSERHRRGSHRLNLCRSIGGRRRCQLCSIGN